MPKLEYYRIFKIVLISFLIGILYNIFAEDGIPFIREKKVLQTANDSLLFQLTQQNFNNLLNISLDQAAALYQEKKAVFIDARDQWDFAEGHIANAINIPEFSFEPNDIFANSLDKSQFYIIYCGSNDCEISERLADELQKIGFTKLAVFKDGWESWLNGGFEVEAGEVE